MDEQAYPASVFKELYHLRWGIEENYKRLKQWAEIENFTGKSALSVKQDFYAKVLSTNLTSKMKNTLVEWFQLTTDRLRKRLEMFIGYIACTIEPVRDGRSYERPKSKQNRRYYCAYKRAR